MIQSIKIQNFKSIADVTLPLGRINVLIGENGCGKSNLLEGIALGAAAVQDKLDNEFLPSRGVRVAPGRMLSSFGNNHPDSATIEFNIPDRSPPVILTISSGLRGQLVVDRDFKVNEEKIAEAILRSVRPEMEKVFSNLQKNPELARRLRLALLSAEVGPGRNFLIYSPENSALRTFKDEEQILPVGIKGSGLFNHLRQLWDTDRELVLKISKHLELIDWFEGFAIPDDLGPGEHRLNIRDRFLAEGGILDQRSANEGFLFLLFYYTLFISPHTPSFFAIDNIDASLNPKLCQRLMRDLTKLAKEHDKQVIFTTHNPAILDGLDLTDDEQRLFVVSRSFEGPTKAYRIDAPKRAGDGPPVALSQAFMRGYLGGLPKNF